MTSLHDLGERSPSRLVVEPTAHTAYRCTICEASFARWRRAFEHDCKRSAGLRGYRGGTFDGGPGRSDSRCGTRRGGRRRSRGR